MYMVKIALALSLSLLAWSAFAEKKCRPSGEAYTLENMNIPACEMESGQDPFKSGSLGGNGFNNTNQTGAPANLNNGNSQTQGFGNNNGSAAGSNSSSGGGRGPASASPANSSSTQGFTSPSPTPSSAPSSDSGSDYNQTYQNDGEAHWIK